MALTELECRNAKAGEKKLTLTDGNGLQLVVSPSGLKTWRLRIKQQGINTSVLIGHYPDLPLAKARKKAMAVLVDVDNGHDPRKQKPADDESPTLRAVAEEWMQKNSQTWKASYITRINQILTANILPTLGEVRVAAMTPAIALEAVRIVESRGAAYYAKRTLELLGQIMRYAVAAQYIPSDPTRDLKGALAKHQTKSFAAATTREDASVIVRAVRNYHGALSVRLALEFLMLTFVRPGNVRHAKWEHIDIEKAVWSIPAEEMKMNRPHEVPLSRQALAVLDTAQSIRRDEYVFPAVRVHARPLSQNTFSTALRTAGICQEQMTAHGFRSMASSLLNEVGERPDIIERQLAHVSADNDKIRAIYNRADYWQARVELMQKWADMVDELATL